jgi:hypothetical protein
MGVDDDRAAMNLEGALPEPFVARLGGSDDRQKERSQAKNSTYLHTHLSFNHGSHG